jgi:hypothetical protein
LELRQITREIIKSVEEISGLPVQVLEDPKLNTIAAVRMARGTMPAHIVLFKPVPGEPPTISSATSAGSSCASSPSRRCCTARVQASGPVTIEF